MSHGPPSYTFLLFGILLGALLGFIYSSWLPPNVSVDKPYVFLIQFTGITTLVFLLLQYILGVMLKRPYESRKIYWGLLIIPVTWFYSILLPETSSLYVYIGTVIIFEIPMLFLYLIETGLSIFLPLLVGYDTYILDSDRVPSETFFGYELELLKREENNKALVRLIERMLSATGFRIYRRDTENQDHGWVLSKKSDTYQSICYETNKQSSKIIFFFFNVNNDTINVPKTYDEILDLHSQVAGLLNDWKDRGVISASKTIELSISKYLEQISSGVGPLKIHMAKIGETIKGYPRAHPFQFAFFITLLEILVSVVLYLLHR